MPETLCDKCHINTATVFITQIWNNQPRKQRLCEDCARTQVGETGWMQQLLGANGNMNLDDIVADIFSSLDFAEDEDDDQTNPFEASADDEDDVPDFLGLGEFPSDEDAIDDMEDLENFIEATQDGDEDGDEDAPGDPFAGLRASREFPATRCPKCDTTWDRLRQDSRAGCAHCYTTFGKELGKVMERVQRAPQHTGKEPRAANKRRRRLEHLRARRDHRLEMLQRRLQEAVAAERYEDAAKLRDKIKIVSSTIVSD